MAGPYHATMRYTLDRFETETSFLRSRKAHNHSGITIQFPGLFAETGSLVTASSSDESCKPSVPQRWSHEVFPHFRFWGGPQGSSSANQWFPSSGARILETRETTEGSAELKFRIHSPPAESLSLAGFRHPM